MAKQVDLVQDKLALVVKTFFDSMTSLTNFIKHYTLIF